MPAKKISIIMRSKNSDWVIASALAALFSQDFQDFELVVVDSGSTDKTLEIVRQYPCRLIQIEAGDYYPGKVLNDAIAATEDEIIVFINSDSVLLCPDSMSQLLKHFDEPENAAVFGRQAPRPEADTWVQRDYALSFPEQGPAPKWITLSLPLAGFRRSVWDQHAFYTQAWASEDSEWGYWASQNGHRVIYEAQALTMHSHNYSLKEVYRRRFVEGEADAFIYQQQVSVLSMLAGFTKACLNDGMAHVVAGDCLGLCMVVPRRWIYYWGHRQGNRLGNQRIQQGCEDSSQGQAVVLNNA